MSNVTALDTDQEDLAEYFEGLAALARQGTVIGVFGCVVTTVDDEAKVAPVEEGYSLSEADVIMCLRFVCDSLEESWQADLLDSMPD